MSDKKDGEKPSSSKGAAFKFKPKEGKKKLENKPALTDLLAKKVSARKRSRSTGAKKGKRASGSRSTSVPPYPKYDFEKFLEKTDPQVVLAKWIERENTPIPDWKILGTVVKVPREERVNDEEEESSESDCSLGEERPSLPKPFETKRAVQPQGASQVNESATPSVLKEAGAAANLTGAEEATSRREPSDAAAEQSGPQGVAEQKKASGDGDDFVVLHKMAALSTKEYNSSDDEYE